MGGSNQTGRRESQLIVALFRVQCSLCFVCHCEMQRHPNITNHALGWSKEHVFPRGGTGRGMNNNFVLSHPACNGDRGGREPTDDEIRRARLIYNAMGLNAFAKQRRGRSINRNAHALITRGRGAWPPKLG